METKVSTECRVNCRKLCGNCVLLLLLMMMMTMINCFSGMVDRRKAINLISTRDHRQKFSPSKVSDMLQVGFEPAQNLRSVFVELSCAVALTTTPQLFQKIFTPGNLQKFRYFTQCVKCDGGPSHVKTSPLICIANQWTSFYMIRPSVMQDSLHKK